MDGVETVQRIREMGGKYRDLPVIALTANAVLGAREMFLSCGFNDFISKPIDSGELARLIKEWLPVDKIFVVDDGEKVIKKTDPELMRFFNQRVLNECAKMSEFLDTNNIKGFAVSVHAMKSSLAIIGEHALSGVAEELETAAKNDELSHCRKYYEKFEKRLRELHERLNVVYPPPKPPQSDEDKLTGESSDLATGAARAIAAAEEFDGDAAIGQIKALSEFDFGEEAAALLNAALTAFEDFDFDKGVEILNTVKEISP
jgi:response regulator RpfG family c-di-GMP phosphodiesterase